MNLLQEYAHLMKEIEKAQSRVKEIANELEAEVKASGHQILDAEYVARMKPGRRLTDHKAAAESTGVSDELIAKFTITKNPVTSWAKVTKEAKISKYILEEYTTQGRDVFSIDKL